MEAFTIATAKTVNFSSSAILSQTKRNFSTHTPLRFLSNNNLRFDNNTNVFFVTSQLNCRISYISPQSKLQRSIKAVTSKRRSDIEMALIGRRMMMNGSMPLVISIMVASLCTTSYSSARASTPEAAFVKKTVSSHDIVIFSKSYCPYCKRAKAVFKELNQAPHVIELDQREDGWGIQDALSEIVGRSTVPQVFVNGKHIGGSDDTVEAYESGKLAKILGVAKDVKNDL